MDKNIRKATLMDIVDIVSLWKAMNKELPLLNMKNSDEEIFFVNLIQYIKTGIVLVAEEDDGKIVGFMNGRILIEDYSKTQKYGFCEHLYVIPGYRDGNISDSLISIGEGLAKQSGASQIEFLCEDNPVIKRFYKSRGYKINQVVFRKEL